MFRRGRHVGRSGGRAAATEIAAACPANVADFGATSAAVKNQQAS